jgi:NifU-like protein involved in Fe-S cluster formation
MNAPLYTTEILRLAAALEAPLELGRKDGHAELRSPTCGSRIATTVALDDAGRVASISQRVHACAFGQASAALLERSAAGCSSKEVKTALLELSNWLQGSDAEPTWPGLLALAPARSRKSRHGAILLPFRALDAALENAARG